MVENEMWKYKKKKGGCVSCNKCLFRCEHKKRSVGQRQAKICFQKVSPRAEGSLAWAMC